jgi:hypothetical protein
VRTFSPPLQNIPWPKQGEVTSIFANARVGKSAFSGRTFTVTRVELRVGDLVEWAPTGKRGLWLVTDLDRWLDPGDVDYSVLEQSVYDEKYRTNPCNEVTLETGEKTNLRVRRMNVPKGKIRLKWFSGWKGHEGKGHPVMVKIEEVTVLNEMETLGLAAS